MEVLKHCGGSFGSDPELLLTSSELPDAPNDELSLQKFTKGQALAIFFSTHADHARFGIICTEPENQFS